MRLLISIVGDEGGGGGRLTDRGGACFVGDCLGGTVAGDIGFGGAGRYGILAGTGRARALVCAGGP